MDTHIYQLMKELFPAEWLPISIAVIFFLGGRSFTPTDSATGINPVENTKIRAKQLLGLILYPFIAFFFKEV